MEKCTIGIVLNITMDRVILIFKDHPDWQKGKYNFPGGHYEDGETAEACISREFNEETDILIPESNWMHVGKIKDRRNSFIVDILVAYKSDSFMPIATTSEPPSWQWINDLPLDIIPNVEWLIAFAKDATHDGPHFATFEYN